MAIRVTDIGEREKKERGAGCLRAWDKVEVGGELGKGTERRTTPDAEARAVSVYKSAPYDDGPKQLLRVAQFMIAAH